MLGVLVPLGMAVRFLSTWRVAWWLRWGRSLLFAQPWAPARATLVRAGSAWRAAVVEVEAVGVVSASLGHAHQEILARTEEALGVRLRWGRVVGRVDGSRQVFGLRPVDAVPVRSRDGEPFHPALLAPRDLRRRALASCAGWPPGSRARPWSGSSTKSGA